MKLDDCLNIHDLQRLAKRKLPRVIYDFIEGGADDEQATQENLAAFRQCKFVPRYLVDVAHCDLSKDILGWRAALPFGIGPTGMADLARHGTDLALAAAARDAGIPFILSGASNASIEATADVYPDAWLQLYVSRDDDITADTIRRGIQAGYKTLVLTVDVPVNSRRERNIRSGWVRPYRPTLPVMLEALRHPAWVAGYLRHGIPAMQTWIKYAPPGASARGIADYYANMLPCPQTWAALEVFRQRWPGKLLVKGLLHPDDALRAKAAGADGVIVSNHGGRQLDRGITTLAALPAMRNAVGPGFPLILDSGIRRGADILAALCLGADYTLVGRATLYGAAAAGRAGIDCAIRILRDELDVVSRQIGCPSVSMLHRGFLADGAAPAP